MNEYNNEGVRTHHEPHVQGGDDWFVDLSRRAPTFYQAAPETATPHERRQNVHQSMTSAETTLGSIRRSILMGQDYPPILNKYSHTRAAAIVEETTRHPVPARIGGLFSSFVGTLHLDYKKSIHQQIKSLRAVQNKKQVSSKLQWTGLPHATARAGPPIRTAPVVEISLSPRKKTAPLLIYEMLEEDVNIHVNDGNSGAGGGGAAGDAKHARSIQQGDRTNHRSSTERMIDSNNTYLYGLKPILSTNACGDGRIHAFHNSEQQLERELNVPLSKTATLQQKNSKSNGTSSVLDLKSPSSPKQRPKFHSSLFHEDEEVVTVLGIDPTGDHHVSMNNTRNGQHQGSPVITQRALQRREKRESNSDENKKVYERYWTYVQNFVPNNDIAPMSMQPLLNVRQSHLEGKLVPPGAQYQMGGTKEYESGSGSDEQAPVAATAAAAAAATVVAASPLNTLVEGVQVSMISSLPDLMPGSGEQLLMKATCRSGKYCV